MENNGDLSMDEVIGPGKPLSDEERALRQAEEDQWWAEREQADRQMPLLALIVDPGTAREKELTVIVRDVTPEQIWEPLTSGIEAAGGASGVYPLPDSLTDDILAEAYRVWSDCLENPEIIYDDDGKEHLADDPYWLAKELGTIAEIIQAIEEFGRQRLSLRFIADWGEQRYQSRQQLKSLGLITEWEERYGEW